MEKTPTAVKVYLGLVAEIVVLTGLTPSLNLVSLFHLVHISASMPVEVPTKSFRSVAVMGAEIRPGKNVSMLSLITELANSALLKGISTDLTPSTCKYVIPAVDVAIKSPPFLTNC